MADPHEHSNGSPNGEQSEENESQIHVDESWKERARREKEQLGKGGTPGESQEQSPAGESPAGEAASQTGSDKSPADRPQPEMGPPPPANFLMFVSSLATQAMVHLGAIPDPATGQPAEDLDHAKYMIDLIEMLQEKTKGNLDDQEAQTLKSVLYDLRMTYVQKTR